MVCQAANFLVISFKAHLGPAQDDFDVRPQGFEQSHHLRGFHHIPDVNAQADDAGLKCQQFFHNLQRPLRNDKLAQLRLRLQTRPAMHVHIGQQVTQSQGCVNVFGIQGG